MARFVRAVRRFAADTAGATMVEYGLLIAFLTLACLGAITLLGEDIRTLLTRLTDLLATLVG